MGACASVAKAMRGGDAGAAAPPPEQPTEETTTTVVAEETVITEKEVPTGEASEIVSEAPKETPEPETTVAPEAEAVFPSVEEKEPQAKA
ncbi:hypothetical protein RHSIM_Rhsim11G0133200 [Rhododendron simsii]|uniref:Uncharacterized protein n=1 Tax=Rhododendron simsii TaxID=118357 RepID=A0A834GAM7_RHOSS|nr:hypothetical protein RHSIM_Rhsim11G0133200 [Rhododendron simsii]